MKTFKRIFVFIAILSVALLVSCDRVQGGDSYTITFDTNGGDAIAQMEVEWGNIPTIPTPTREGYTFTGWYFEDGTKLTDEYVYTDNVKLVAKWQINKYKVTYMLDEETVYETITDDYGKALSVKAPEKENYSFVGWFTDKELTKAFNNRIQAKEVTIYAKFASNQAVVKYNSNGAISYQTMEDSLLKWGENVELRENTFTIPGYSFAGWSTELNGEKVYDDKGSLTGISENNMTITLYALWTPVSYNVEFSSNGSLFDSYEGAYLSNLVLPANNPTKTGYHFAKWVVYELTTDETALENKQYFASNNGIMTLLNVNAGDALTGEVYEQKEVNSNTTIPLNGFTVYATFEANNYEVEFLANTGSGEMAKQQLTYDKKANLTQNSFEKLGYAFIGWAKEENGQVVYANTDEVLNLTAEENGTVKLYATWKANSYSIIFDANGATGRMEDLVLAYDEVANLPACTLTKLGYDFAGWKLGEETLADLAQVKNLVSDDKGSVTLKALWDARNDTKYTVVYYLENVAGDGYQTSQEELKGVTDSNATFNEKAFTGFVFDSENTNNQLTTTITADGKALLKAYYNRALYNVTFKENEVITTKQVRYEDSLELLPTELNKLGYTYALSLNEEVFTADTIVTSDVEVKVTYTANSYQVKFDANEGLGEMVSQTFTYDLAQALALNQFTRTGYTFAGWTFGEENFTDGQEVKNLTATNNGSVTLKAVWSINQYSIKFYNEENGSLVKEIKQNYNSQIKSEDIPTDLTKLGYEFNEWNQTIPAQMPAGDLDIYALWTANKYSVVFDANLGSGSMANQNLTYDKEEALVSNQFTRTGYTFAGWTIGEENLTDGQTVKNLTATNNGSVTLKAVWTPNTNTKYVVKHLTQDLNLQGYTLNSQEEKTGTTDSKVTPETKSIYGFTAPVAKEVTILADGSLVLEYRYTRNQFTVTFKSGNETVSESKVYYEGKLGNLSLNRTGYTYELTLDGNEFDTTMQIVEDLEIVVTYTAIDYAVTFHNQNSLEATKEYPYGTTVQLPAATKEGYTFLGWADREDGEVSLHAGDDLTIEGLVELYAVWQANTYTVKFDTNGGTGEMADQTHTYDQAQQLTKSTLTKVGYTFAGWTFADNNYVDEQEVKNLTATNGLELTFVALWQANKYQVKFNANTGEGVMANQAFTYNVGQTLNAATFTKTGYTFAGWLFGNKTYADQELVINLTALDNEELTFSAIWAANSYQVKFNGNGGLGEMADQAFDYDQEENLSKNLFTKYGYEFAGWSKTLNGQKVYNDEQKVNNLTALDNEVITLYAVWTPKTVLVSFDYNAGTGSEENVEVLFDGTYGELPVATRTGYQFAGYEDEAHNKVTSTTKVTNEEAHTLTALWTANNFTVKFDANLGTGSMSDQEFTYDEAEKLTKSTFTKVGHKFLGWALDSNAETATYADEVEVSNLTTENNGEVVLYAVWQIQSYTISFHLNNDNAEFVSYEGYTLSQDGKTASYTATYGSAMISAPVAECAGRDFITWGALYKTMPANNVDSYAYWSGVSQYLLSIYIDTTSGSKYLDALVEYGADLASYVPTKAGYSVALFDEDGNAYTLEGKTMPNNNLVLVVKFNAEAFEIELHNGEEVTKVEKNYDEAYQLTRLPNTSTHEFVGWNTKADGSGEFYYANEIIYVKANLTLYAIWNDVEYTVTYYDRENGNVLYETISKNLTTSSFMDYIDELTALMAGYDAMANASKYAIDNFLGSNSIQYITNIAYLGYLRNEILTNELANITFATDQAYIMQYILPIATASGDGLVDAVTALSTQTPVDILLALQALTASPADPSQLFALDLTGKLYQEAYEDTVNLIKNIVGLQSDDANLNLILSLYNDVKDDQYVSLLMALAAASADEPDFGPITTATNEKYDSELTNIKTQLYLAQQGDLSAAQAAQNAMLDLYAKLTQNEETVQIVLAIQDAQKGNYEALLSLSLAENSSYLTKLNKIKAALAHAGDAETFIGNFANEILAKYGTIVEALLAAQTGSTNPIVSVVTYFVYYANWYQSLADNNALHALPEVFKKGSVMANLAVNYPNDQEALANTAADGLLEVRAIFNTYKDNAFYPYREGYAFDKWVFVVDANTHTANYYATWKSQLATPKGLSLESFKQNYATFTWDSVLNASAYDVTYSVNGGADEVVRVVSNHITIEGLKNKDEVVLNVKAISDPESIQLQTEYNNVLYTSELYELNSNASITLTYTHQLEDTALQETDKEGNYFYKVGDTYHLFVSQSYNFGSEISKMTVDNGKAENDYAKVSVINNKYYLITKTKAGNFTFTITKIVDGHESDPITYNAQVHYLVQDIVTDTNLSTYELNKANALKNNDTFLEQSNRNYSVGYAHTGYNNGYSYEYNEVTYTNGFYLDFTASTTSGINVPIEFSVKVFEGEEECDSTVYVYDYRNNVIYFLEKANNHVYTIVIAPKEDEGGASNTQIPKAYKDGRFEKSFTVAVNNGYNVYDDATLKVAYANTSVENINIHSNIKAILSPNMTGYYQYLIDKNYYGNGYVGNASTIHGISELNVKDGTAIMTTDTTYGPKIWVESNSSDYVFKAEDGKYYKYQLNGDYVLKACEWVEATRTNADNYGSFKILNDQINMVQNYKDRLNLKVAFIYQRVNNQCDVENNLTVNGNYFNIDGSKLPYMASQYKVEAVSAAAYEVQNIQVSIFGLGANPNYVNTNHSKDNTPSQETNVYFNDLSLEGNTMDVSAWLSVNSGEVTSIADYMSKTSGGFCGFKVSETGARDNDNPQQPVTTMHFDNVFIKNTLIALYSDYCGSIEANKTHVKQSWANSLYSHGGHSNKLVDSYIETSGGGALHIEDVYFMPELGKEENNTLVLVNTRVENMIAGDEQWFKAYNMSVMALGMKSMLQSAAENIKIAQVGAPNGFDVVTSAYDSYSGQYIDKMNLVGLGKVSAVSDSTPWKDYIKNLSSEDQLTKEVADVHLEYLFENAGDMSMALNATTELHIAVINGQQRFFLEVQQDAGGMLLYIVLELTPRQ